MELPGKVRLASRAMFSITHPESDGYSPLRRITFVTWVDGKSPKLVTSEADILKNSDSGDITLEKSEIVVNMPFMSWDGGKR